MIDRLTDLMIAIVIGLVLSYMAGVAIGHLVHPALGQIMTWMLWPPFAIGLDRYMRGSRLI